MLADSRKQVLNLASSVLWELSSSEGYFLRAYTARDGFLTWLDTHRAELRTSEGLGAVMQDVSFAGVISDMQSAPATT